MDGLQYYVSYDTHDFYSGIENFLIGLFGVSGFALLLMVLFIGAAIYLVCHYFEAIPVYIIAKKNGYRYAWVSLIPVAACKLFVLSALPGERDTKLLGKWSMKNLPAFIIYILLPLIGPSFAIIAGSIVSIVLLLIPFIGALLSPLAFLAAALIFVFAVLMFEYAFLRDIADLYGSDKDSNSTTAIVIVVLNFFFKIVRPIYLWTLVGKQPIHNRFEAEFTEVP